MRCWSCGKEGHLPQVCPDKVKVDAYTVEDLQKLGWPCLEGGGFVHPDYLAGATEESSSEFAFELGDRVRVDHENLGPWEGEVTWRNHQGDTNEYIVSNHPQIFPGAEQPVLAWEDEMTLLEEGEDVTS